MARARGAIVAWALAAALCTHAEDSAIYLFGSTPDGLRSEWLGWYSVYTGKPIVTKSKLIDGRSVYAKKGEASKLIWFNKKSGRWYAGKARALGKAAGVFHVADVAMTPDKATGKWQAWVGPKRGWVEAPDMRVVDSAQGRAIVDSDAKALQDASTMIRLDGSTPHGVRHEWLGIYERRLGIALVGGRPSYAKRHDDSKYMWYYAPSGTWFMGGQASIGKSKGVLQAHDTAIVPDKIRAGGWLVGQGQGRGWVSAPDVRWLAGVDAEAANLAEAGRVQSSARTVYLFDGRMLLGTQIMPANMAPAWQGAYAMESANVSDSGGRARYVKPGDASGNHAWILWYDAQSGTWQLGRENKRALTKTMLSVYDGALLPNEIKGEWKRWQPSGVWEPVAVRCLIGVEGAAVLQEQSAAGARIIAASAPTLHLVGLSGQRHEWLGSYTRRAGSLTNGRHSFVHEADETKVMWYDDRSASWRVGVHEAYYGHEERFHPNKAVLRAIDPALVPERVAASWMMRTSDDTHGGEDEAWSEVRTLRCIGGLDIEVELQAQVRELRLAGPTVYLAGAMPPSFPPGVLGAYDLVQPTGKQSARRTYLRRDDPKTALSYRLKTGDWVVERQGGDKGAEMALLLSAYDGALLPERISATWRVHTTEGYWTDAPNLKCRAGPDGKAAMEADLAAVSLEQALTPGWLLSVRQGPAVEATRVALRAGLQPWRIHAELANAKGRGVSDSVLDAARKLLPLAFPPSPPPPSPTPVASPPPPLVLSPPSPLASPPPPPVSSPAVKQRSRKKGKKKRHGGRKGAGGKGKMERAPRKRHKQTREPTPKGADEEAEDPEDELKR